MRPNINIPHFTGMLNCFSSTYHFDICPFKVACGVNFFDSAAVYIYSYTLLFDNIAYTKYTLPERSSDKNIVNITNILS